MRIDPVKAVPIILYALLIIGEIILFSNSFVMLFRRMLVRSSIDRSKEVIKDGIDRSGLARFSKELKLALGISDANAVIRFVSVSVLAALLVFALLIGSFGLRVALTGFLLAGLTPFALVKTRLRNMQVDMSREGETLLTELLNNYRINHYNMKEAIEKTALTIEDAPCSRKQLLDLSKALTLAESRQDIRNAIEVFRLSLSTSWGNVLATNMEFAEFEGIRVTESLKDLVDSIIKARRNLEMTKRETADSGLVLKFIFPCVLLMIYFGSTAAFGMSPQEFVNYQFRTPTGLMWAMLLTASFIVSLLVSAYIARQKMDL